MDRGYVINCEVLEQTWGRVFSKNVRNFVLLLTIWLQIAQFMNADTSNCSLCLTEPYFAANLLQVCTRWS